MEGVDKDVINSIAQETQGFSGRELTKMVIAWHDAAFTLPDPVLSPELMQQVLKKFKLQHKLKDTWSSEERKLMEKLINVDEAEIIEERVHHETMERTEELMGEINKEREEIKHFREKEDSKQTAKKMQQQNKQK